MELLRGYSAGYSRHTNMASCHGVNVNSDDESLGASSSPTEVELTDTQLLLSSQPSTSSGKFIDEQEVGSSTCARVPFVKISR